ncbi:MAG: S41 family peptidase [Alloprevotella sp.]
MKHYTSRLLPLGVTAAIVVGVLIGNFYSNLFSGNRVSFINTSSNKINDLMQIISDRYVDTINMGDFVERTMPQILKELDPHSTYISAKDVEASMQDLKGSFSGIGVQFTIYDDTVRIVRVIEGGPSERVGLRAGDCIVSVDQKPYVGKVVNNDETMKRLKGAAGSTVRLGIKRHGEKALQHFSITRGAVPVKSVDAAYMMDAQTGYIRINTWGDNTYPEVLSSLASLNAQGLEQLVIDLRGNLGGYLQAAVQVANEFLPKNRLIVYNEGVHFPREDFKSDGRGAYQTLPLVVLVDETSASASEIFAGAMQDNDRATLIGRRTFGKGLVQVPIEFRDGSMLRLTTARYYTPSGRCVQKPFTPGDEATYEADLLERAATGEYFSSDSIKTSGQKYKTRIGRIVYGGGGIIPDYFVPRDTLGITPYYKDVYLDGTLYQFAYWYVDKHRTRLSKFDTPIAVAKYLRQQNLVEAFANYAEQHGNKRRNLMIKTSHKLIERQLTSLILGDLLGTPAAVEFSNATDPFLLQATAIFKQGKAFPQKETTISSPKTKTTSWLPPHGFYDQTRNSLFHSATQTSVALRESTDSRRWTVARVFAKARRLLFG